MAFSEPAAPAYPPVHESAALGARVACDRFGIAYQPGTFAFEA